MRYLFLISALALPLMSMENRDNNDPQKQPMQQMKTLDNKQSSRENQPDERGSQIHLIGHEINLMQLFSMMKSQSQKPQTPTEKLYSALKQMIQGKKNKLLKIANELTTLEDALKYLNSAKNAEQNNEPTQSNDSQSEGNEF